MRNSNQIKRQNFVIFVSIALVFIVFVLFGVQTQAIAGRGKATATPTVPPTATPPPGPTPGPCTTCNGNLPAHVLTGYWQDFVNTALPLRLRDVPTSYGLVAVAFAGTGASTGSITFGIDAKLSSALSGYSITDFANDVQLLHSQGRKVILSVGGAAGNVTIASASAASNFATSAYALMTQYGFDGVDIDLENGINVTYLTSALQQLSSLSGPSLVITMAPQTVDVQPGGAYLQVAINIKSILTIVNTQYYNSGSMYGCNNVLYQPATEDFITGQACILLQNGLRPDQVGLGLPASPSAAGKGYVSPSVVNNALDCLETGQNCASFHPSTTYVPMRGAMDWSINWDASNNYQFATNVSGHFGLLP
ncbi:MAG TPA: chitinase [Aggregatilineales bacterium]|nr:chitinase [Aggregatilineales bacterium]